MAEEQLMLHDMVEEHGERMMNLKRYYPFFSLFSYSFAGYKEGRYQRLDMAYITLAVLRFFIEENNFKDKDVTYEEYTSFFHVILNRDFEYHLEKEEEKELASFLFDKLTNEGKSFTIDYFDPVDKQKKHLRTKLIDSRIENQSVYYFITADAVAFYLDTKEIKEESSITIEQLLLSKLISANNFQGAIEVVRRINQEVNKLRLMKHDVMSLLSRNVFEGKVAYDQYVESVTKWFDEEQRLFRKNSELIEKALKRAESAGTTGEASTRYYRAVNEIYQLEVEMKRAKHRHSELLKDCADLQKKSDELVTKSKLSALRNAFDFQSVCVKLMEQDDASLLSSFVMPLFQLNRKKRFPFAVLDELLTYRSEKKDYVENIGTGEEEIYIYEDEIEEQRIHSNFLGFFLVLWELSLKKEQFTLMEYQDAVKNNLGEDAPRNADLYTFLIHMCQKSVYDFGEIAHKPDTFFEEQAKQALEEARNPLYKNIKITLTMCGDDTIQVGTAAEISNIIFQTA